MIMIFLVNGNIAHISYCEDYEDYMKDVENDNSYISLIVICRLTDCRCF
jgi:hypothetical protein